MIALEFKPPYLTIIVDENLGPRCGPFFSSLPLLLALLLALVLSLLLALLLALLLPSFPPSSPPAFPLKAFQRLEVPLKPSGTF